MGSVDQLVGELRGQSGPIALILVFGLVIAGTTLVAVLGAGAISTTQDQLRSETAANSLTQLDSEASLVALGQTGTQTVELNSGSSSSYRLVESGRMTVTVEGISDPIVDEQLGSIVYEGENGQTVAYQGGGVWQSDGDGGSTMISPPELYYQGETLTLPLVTIGGDSTLSGSATLSFNNSTQAYPNTTESPPRQNPVETGEVQVTVQSEYYEAWAEYFESRTDGGVTTDDENNEATLRLLQEDDRTIRDAVSIGGSSDAELEIQSGDTVVVSNYDSAVVDADEGDAPSASGTSGLTTNMDVEFIGSAQIEGNLTTGGEVVSFGSNGQSAIDDGGNDAAGNLRYTEGSVSSSDCADQVDGWCNDNASLEPASNLNNEIDTTISNLQSDSNNNNSETDCLTDSGLTFSDPDCPGDTDNATLEAGSYYIDNGDFSVGGDDNLTLDTRDGDITIVLDNDRTFTNNGNITVEGDGRVSVYATSEINVEGNGAIIWNRGWDADQFWLYCDANCHVDVTQQAIFNGVVYAPPGPGGNSGEMEIRQNSEVYGAIIAGGESTAEIGQNSEVYFDEDLNNAQVFERRTVPSISYLHVSVNRLNVTSP